MSQENVVMSSSNLAAHLLRRAEVLSPDSHYRLARIVARVLVSRHLRERRKWCDLARALAADEAVEERPVRQAIGSLNRHGRGVAP
jgi:hypothetical protein